MTVGESMKEIRKRLGMSQVAFADKINVSKQTLYKYENNIITNIPSDKIEAAAELGNVSPAYLMGWEMDDGDIGNAFMADSLEDEIDSMKSFSPSEKNHFKAYINLLEINRKKVDDYTKQLLSIQQMENDVALAAAHERTDIKVNEDMRKHDDDIMMDDSEWE